MGVSTGYFKTLLISFFTALIFSGGAFAQLSPGGGGLSGIPDPLNIDEIRLSDGLTSAPSLSFIDDTDTGIWRSGSERLHFSSSGTNALSITSTVIRVSETLLSGSGGGAPGDSSAFTAYADGSGIFRVGSSGATANALADDLVIENSSNSGLSLLAPSTSNTYIMFGNEIANLRAMVAWNESANNFVIQTRQAGDDLVLYADNIIENVRLSGASGSELAEFVGDVDIGGGLDVVGAVTAPSISFDSGTNQIDFYETGEWTPEFDDANDCTGTGATGTGRYTRIGNIVTLFVTDGNIDTTGLSGTIYICGMPFDRALPGVSAVDAAHITNMTTPEAVLVRSNDNDTMNFWKADGTGTLSFSDLTDDASNISFSTTYLTDE